MQGIEFLRNLIAGDQDTQVWLFFLLPSAPLDNLLLDLASFHRWRAVELLRARPFSAVNSQPQSRLVDGDLSDQWPSASPSLSMSLTGVHAGLEVMVDSYAMIDGDGDGFIDEQEFEAYLAANRTVRLGAEFVRVSGVMLHYKGETKPYKGINGDYQRSQEVSNGRAVYIKVNKPSTAMWWTNNNGKICWCVGPKEQVGTDKMWGYVESMGFGPEEAERRPWVVYSYNSGSWEGQSGVEVLDLDRADELGSSSLHTIDEMSTEAQVEASGSSAAVLEMPEQDGPCRPAMIPLPLLSSSEVLGRALAWLAAVAAAVAPRARPSMVSWCARVPSAYLPSQLPPTHGQAHTAVPPSMVSWCSSGLGAQALNEQQQGVSWLPVLTRQRVIATPRMSSLSRESNGKTPRTAQLAPVEKRVEEALAQQIRSRPQTPLAPQDPAQPAAAAGFNKTASSLQSPNAQPRFDCTDACLAALSQPCDDRRLGSLD